MPDTRQKRLDGSELVERAIAFVPPEFDDDWLRVIHMIEDVSTEYMAL
ncbi:MAG: hypothetical protein GDA49_01865 [Rhodospirillales bacterium]|nr:hypothetical protein [Rhodospirillales bacterium]